MITVYGIPNCDTVKKARAWLNERGQRHAFHDFKKQGVSPQQLAHWSQALGWQKLINRQGATWRKMDAATQRGAQDEASAAALMGAHPSLIKRPVVDWGESITLGFDAAAWADRLGV